MIKIFKNKFNGFIIAVMMAIFIIALLWFPSKEPWASTKVDPVILKSYEGHYQVTKEYTISITSQYGYLYYQPSTQSYGDKLLAKSPIEFYLEEWGETVITFKKSLSRGELDLFIVIPNKTPRRCPRVKKPITIELDPVGNNPLEVFFTPIDDQQKDEIRKTLKSLKKEGDLYLMTFHADYSELISKISGWDFRIDKKTIPKNSYQCSLFSVSSTSGKVFYGRNFDNRVCDVLAVKYQPVKGFTSLALTRLSDLGFATGTDLLQLPLEKRLGLLAAPGFIADGMNEKGIVIGVASVKQQPVIVNRGKKTIFFMRLLREILDSCSTLEEVISTAKKYNIYDEKDGNCYSIAHHMLISDAYGKSIVLENKGGFLKIVRGQPPWQLALNSPLYNISEEERKIECQRYQILSSSLTKYRDKMNWLKGMELLRRVALKGRAHMSCWSSVYDVKEKSIYLTIHKKYQTPFKLKL